MTQPLLNIVIIGYCVTAGLISLLLCFFAPQIGKALGLVDDPKAKKHSLHEQKTPLVGGLAIIAPWILLGSLNLSLYGISDFRTSIQDAPSWFSIVVLLFMLIGMLDDRFHLSANLRLMMTAPLFAGIVLTYPQFGIDTLTEPAFGISVQLGWLAAPFSTLCLLAYTNAVNMADGRNGLVIGLGLIWCSTLSFHVPPPFQLILYAVIASLLVTGLFNLKGRLFLGDGGTYALAAMIGLTGLLAHSTPVGAGGISSTQLAALFAIPGLDMFRLMVDRTLRGMSAMSGDHDHLHHRLERAIGWRLGLPTYLALVGVSSLIAFSGPLMGLPGLIVAVGLYWAVWYFTRHTRQQEEPLVGVEVPSQLNG